MDTLLKWRSSPRPTAPQTLGRFGVLGALVGALVAAALNMPASWLAASIGTWSDGRVQWLNATGTIWDGQATLSLGAGPGSLAPLSLPQRLSWVLRPALGAGGTPGVTLSLHHPVLLPQPVQVRAHVGVASASFGVFHGRAQDSGPIQVQLPVAWLAGLGAPWNTLQPSGQMKIRVDRLEWSRQGASPPALDVALTIQLLNIASRVSTLPVLGHYDIDVRGGRDVSLRLASRPGSALLLEGKGQWRPGEQVGFRGHASAAEGREEALTNLLNIIGRREGPRSLMAFGSSAVVGKPSTPTQ